MEYETLLIYNLLLLGISIFFNINNLGQGLHIYEFIGVGTGAMGIGSVFDV